MANEASREQFEPLFRSIAKLGLTPAEREETTQNYMFMYKEDGVYAYKHYWTRHYVYLDEVGAIQDGVLDTGNYNFLVDEVAAAVDVVSKCFVCEELAASTYAGAPICATCETIVNGSQTTARVHTFSDEARRKMAILMVRAFHDLEAEEDGQI